MSWEPIDQLSPTAAARAPCRLALAPRRSGGRLWVTISAELRQALGWQLGERFGLDVGEDENAGKIRVRRDSGGRCLRKLPRSEYVTLELVPPDALARWEAARHPAEHQVLKGGVLVATLPWDFSAVPAEPAEGEEVLPDAA